MQQSRKPWTKEEDDAVIQIVEDVGLKNWPLVSTLMKEKYNVIGRSGKQCRQRWHNQLNPQVNKKPWNQQEEKLLFEAHKTYRNRWIDISKLFQGRTDNSVKNHFYSTIRRSLRRICKLLGNKNSTSKLRNIKPSILSKIFQYSELNGDQVTSENEYIVNESKIITEELLNFARSKPAKTNDNFEEEKKKNLQALIDKLNQFSKNCKSQKENSKLENFLKQTSLKISKVINEKNADNNENQQNIDIFQSKISKQFTSIPSKIIKNYSYDWEEFQKRCLYVKNIFQNQTESYQTDSPFSKIQHHPSSDLQVNDQFSLEEKYFSDKGQTHTPPRSQKVKQFEPSQTLNNFTTQMNEYNAMAEKRKYQVNIFQAALL